MQIEHNEKLFFEKMKNMGWNVSLEIISPVNVRVDSNATNMLQKAPKEFIDFICSYSNLSNSEENIWFLSYQDYISDDRPFPWDEFKKQSIECADNDNELIENINSYWAEHIPFMFSVEGGYSYISIGISKDNFGKIFHGIEPEYEDSRCIANSLKEFLSSFTKIFTKYIRDI